MNRVFLGTLRVVLVLGAALAGPLPIMHPASGQSPLPEPAAKFDAAHRVEFPSLLSPASDRSAQPAQLHGYLFKPEGAGPFPAVVMGHGCSGLSNPPGRARWIDRVVSWGHVALLVDSFTPRGAKTCNDGKADDLLRAADAYGALKFLGRQSFVDARRIAAMSWGEGGSAVFLALESGPNNPQTPNIALAKPEVFAGLRFRGAVAVYPESCFSYDNFYAPVLWLYGEKTGSRAMAACARETKKLTAAGVRISVQVYPNATFGFDQEYEGSSPAGDPIRYDPAATADAVERVKQFLAANL